MQIELTPVDRLPSIHISQTNSADQVARIVASIAAFSSPNPLPTGEDGVIIAGRGVCWQRSISGAPKIR